MFQVSEFGPGGGYGSWVQGVWFWDFRWSRELSAGEFELFHDFLQAVTQSPTLGADDPW
ncbi:hypothetical protein A2U01_0043794, partial [Trifolium medium]|nr:hypothetical protein [Trifolium medium]